MRALHSQLPPPRQAFHTPRRKRHEHASVWVRCQSRAIGTHALVPAKIWHAFVSFAWMTSLMFAAVGVVVHLHLCGRSPPGLEPRFDSVPGGYCLRRSLSESLYRPPPLVLWCHCIQVHVPHPFGLSHSCLFRIKATRGCGVAAVTFEAYLAGMSPVYPNLPMGGDTKQAECHSVYDQQGNGKGTSTLALRCRHAVRVPCLPHSIGRVRSHPVRFLGTFPRWTNVSLVAGRRVASSALLVNPRVVNHSFQNLLVDNYSWRCRK